MEITDIDTTLLPASEYHDSRHYCIVRIETDAGITGFGEATAPGMERATEQAVHDLGRQLLGRDPQNIEGLWDRLYNAYAWNFGAVGVTALSGLEMALWDIVGKHHDVRVCELLGGPQTERIKVYANGFYDAEGDPSSFAADVRGVVERGFDVVKFDPFYDDGERAWPMPRQKDLAEGRLQAVDDEVGDEALIAVEFHGIMSPGAAVDCASMVSAFDPLFIEEPVPPENHDAMRRIRDRVGAPIATGERLLTVFDYRDFFQHPTATDIVQPDVNNCGGISQLKKIAAMAYAEYIPVAPHNSRGPVATAAAAHACSTIPNFFILEYFPDTPGWRQDVLETPEIVEDGYYHLPDGPGLGVEIDEEVFAEFGYEKSDRTDQVYSKSYRDLW